VRNGARARDISIDMSIEDAWASYTSQQGECYYTGEPIRFAKDWNDEKGTASLDRTYSDIRSYSASNTKWVHKIIQKMKLDLAPEEFIKRCCQVADRFREGKINIERPQ
jgi:hypothetical protein